MNTMYCMAIGMYMIAAVNYYEKKWGAYALWWGGAIIFSVFGVYK